MPERNRMPVKLIRVLNRFLPKWSTINDVKAFCLGVCGGGRKGFEHVAAFSVFNFKKTEKLTKIFPSYFNIVKVDK
jgi:hypothetical protein